MSTSVSATQFDEGEISVEIEREHPSGAKARVDSVGLIRG